MIAGKKPAPRPKGPGVNGGSREARKVVAAVLEVLAGSRTPLDAAKALGVSAPRYYVLESRALAGMVTACEPRAKGRTRTPEMDLAALRKEHERVKRECARAQALVRASQRAVGLSTPKPEKKSGERGKRRRKPVVRALKVVDRLQSEPPDQAGPE
jgi:hypothetical protein